MELGHRVGVYIKLSRDVIKSFTDITKLNFSLFIFLLLVWLFIPYGKVLREWPLTMVIIQVSMSMLDDWWIHVLLYVGKNILMSAKVVDFVSIILHNPWIMNLPLYCPFIEPLYLYQSLIFALFPWCARMTQINLVWNVPHCDITERQYPWHLISGYPTIYPRAYFYTMLLKRENVWYQPACQRTCKSPPWVDW